MLIRQNNPCPLILNKEEKQNLPFIPLCDQIHIDFGFVAGSRTIYVDFSSGDIASSSLLPQKQAAI